MCVAGPFVGKLADSRGPRPGLSLSFVLLPIGYLGIKAVYDASEGSTDATGGGTLLTLILFELFTGIGSEAGYAGALNVVVKSFPDKIVSLSSDFIMVILLILPYDTESDDGGNHDFGLRTVGFPFFYHRTHNLPRRHL